MNNSIEKIKLALNTHKTFLFMFILFVLIYIITSLVSATSKNTEQAMVTPDTLIPRGHVLIPIELENIETITGLIENYGVIDIYLGKKLTETSQKILNKVKIIRAPLNPQKFAILLPENAAKVFMKYNGLFVGAVQNKADASIDPLVEKIVSKKSRIEIDYNGEH